VAQHASALKAERQSINRRARNRANLSLMKTHLKKLREAITKGDTDTASKALSETVGQIDKAAKKGVIHDNAASRYKSRLTKKVNALQAKKA
jgi:small subunit ribosomal protein S20